MTGRTKELLGWAACVAGVVLLGAGACAWLNGCNLTPAQDARIARAWVSAACVTAETVDPALEQNNLVELLCPAMPSAPAPDAAPSVTVNVTLQPVVISKAAWRDTLHGTQAVSAPLDAGAGG